MTNAVKVALDLKLKGIAITDHYDIDAPNRESEFSFDPIEQQAEIERLSVELCNGNQLEILKGIELGLQQCSLKKIKDFASNYKFDTIIASVHFIDGLDPYHQSYYEGKDYIKAYSRALETIVINATKYADFDILGHFDYITRYRDYPVREIRYQQFSDYLDPLLKFLAREGKALEVNTNTYRTRFNGCPNLDINILKRFKELKGEAISLGSDAHECNRIAENFELYSNLIKSCGFKYLAYYKDRKAQFYSI